MGNLKAQPLPEGDLLEQTQQRGIKVEIERLLARRAAHEGDSKQLVKVVQHVVEPGLSCLVDELGERVAQALVLRHDLDYWR